MKDIYKDVMIPYISKEDMKEMIDTAEVFTVVNIGDRVSSFRGKQREDWVITLEFDDGDKGLLTLSKSANRDTQMENLKENLPVEGCKLTRMGKSKAYVIVPEDYEVPSDEEQTERAATAKKRAATAKTTRRTRKRR